MPLKTSRAGAAAWPGHSTAGGDPSGWGWLSRGPPGKVGFQQAAQTTLAAAPARSHTPPQGTLGSVPGVGSALGWVWAGTGCPRRGQQPAGEASEARGPTWTPRAWRQCPADCMHQTTPHHAPPCVGKLGIAAVPSWTLRGWGSLSRETQGLRGPGTGGGGLQPRLSAPPLACPHCRPTSG